MTWRIRALFGAINRLGGGWRFISTMSLFSLLKQFGRRTRRVFASSVMIPISKGTYKEEEEEEEPSLSYLNPMVIFVLGGPGAGKGTQCSRLASEYGWKHISAGDLLRAEQDRYDSPYKSLIEICIKEGMIVPHHVTISLLKAEMARYPPNTVFLVDGFPREIDQAQAFERNVAKMTLTLFFDCDESVMVQRLVERGRTSGRSDDNLESIVKRFRTHKRSVLGVISYYEAMGKVKRIQCAGSRDQVFASTIQTIHESIPKL